MPLELFFAIIIIIVLLAGSYTDIKTREVPDWVNFSFIISALGIRGIWSIAASDWRYISYGLMGFLLCVAIAYAMFYAGQWGGGDAKMIMGIGAMMGLQLDIDAMLVGFLMNTLLVGAVYALVWGMILIIKNRKQFMKHLRKIVHNKRMLKIRKLVIISAAVLLVVALAINEASVKFLILGIVILYVTTFYLWIFVKAIEKCCMLKKVTPDKLTEGDWIAKDVIVGGKRITGPKDLGISLEQIKELKRLKKQKKIDKVLIKEGIPFVPSFLLAFIATWIFGNLFLLVL
ncbi:hypothetical protein GF345_00875 [Candidatus Woesearchaeota archaeon]|nr:hypothetical protein [Candidatus Woesearchaeota archaeon]